MTFAHEKIERILREAAAEFFLKEADRSSLLTVTRIELSEENTRATIFLSVLPEEKEEAALGFVKRSQKEFYEHLKKKTRIRNIPSLFFEIDEGEKNRRRLDEISNTSD